MQLQGLFMRNHRLLGNLCCVVRLHISGRHFKMSSKGIAGKSKIAMQMTEASDALEMPSAECTSKLTETGLNDIALQEESLKRQRFDSATQDECQIKKKMATHTKRTDTSADRKHSGSKPASMSTYSLTAGCGQSLPSTSSDAARERKSHWSERASGSSKPARSPAWRCLRDRRWEIIHSNKKHFQGRHHFTFKVASYNVLAQNLLEDHTYLYEGTPQEYLDWNYRKSNLISEIEQHSPAILCMQEVQESQFHEFFLPELAKRGYNGVHKARTGDKSDGCAIFFKTKKFKLEQSVPVSFYRSKVNVLDRDNVGLLLKLRPISRQTKTKTKVVVATTHLLYNPRRGDVKLAQLMVLLAEIDKLSFDPRWKNGKAAEHCPVILCGDFNSFPHSPLYDLLLRGRLDLVNMSQRFVSGQSDWSYGGPLIQIPLLPPIMGIVDTCQYYRELTKRFPVDRQSFAGATDAQVDQVDAQCCTSETSLPNSLYVDFDSHAPGYTLNSSTSVTVVDMKAGAPNLCVKAESSISTTVIHSTSASAVVGGADISQSPAEMSPGTRHAADSSKNVIINESSSKTVNKDTPSTAFSLHTNYVYGGPELLHPFNFKSAYEHNIQCSVKHQLITSSHKRDVSAVDYILYHSHPDPGQKSPALQINRRLKLLTVGDQQRHQIFLPNEHVSSDHMILLAEFNLRLK